MAAKKKTPTARRTAPSAAAQAAAQVAVDRQMGMIMPTLGAEQQAKFTAAIKKAGWDMNKLSPEMKKMIADAKKK